MSRELLIGGINHYAEMVRASEAGKKLAAEFEAARELERLGLDAVSLDATFATLRAISDTIMACAALEWWASQSVAGAIAEVRAHYRHRAESARTVGGISGRENEDRAWAAFAAADDALDMVEARLAGRLAR